MAELDARAQLEILYGKHCPENLAKIDGLLEKYRGQEEELVAAVREKYLPKKKPRSTPAPRSVSVKSEVSKKDQTVPAKAQRSKRGRSGSSSVPGGGGAPIRYKVRQPLPLVVSTVCPGAYAHAIVAHAMAPHLSSRCARETTRSVS